MENILIIALYYIKEYVYYIILSSLAFLCWVIALLCVVSLIKKKKVNLKRYNLLFLISTIVFVNGIIIEYFLYQKVFKNLIDIIIGVSILGIIGLLGNVILSLFNFDKKVIVVKENNDEVSIPRINKEKSVEVLSCIEEPVSVYGGYIDVNYLKGLIDSLKQKDLEFEDEREVEDLEVYLLNFVNRQPSNYERSKLSCKVEKLIKKLAKYNVI